MCSPILDFKQAVGESGDVDRTYIDERAARLRDNGAITAPVFAALELGKIYSFFESEIGRRAAAAAGDGTLEKEKPFTLRVEHKGKQVLVQGIIDCYFRDGDKLVLVDYKSNRLSRKNQSADLERIKEEYREQIDLYKRALEEGTGSRVEEAYLYLFDKHMCISMI